MYYSFYLNERMLLDNWKYYQGKGECNWLLKRTLMNDNTRTAEEKIKFYMENRRIVNYYSDFFKEQAEIVYWKCLEAYINYDTKAEAEYALDNMFINDDYEMMDYGRNQRLFNMYRRYNDLKMHANGKIERQLSFEPIKGAKFREYKSILINNADIKFIRHTRKHNTLTVPQIEVLFGIIFFCRMNASEKANLDSEFKMKQFLGCFDAVTMEDFEYVVSHVQGIGKTDSGDYTYHISCVVEEDDTWIEIPVTKTNNRLNLTKMAHKYITDISNKRYCQMCLKPFKPTNNRQKVCSECKPKADAIKTKMRKVKQRYIQKNGETACCGACTDCIKPDCGNWWEYWQKEFDARMQPMSQDKKGEILDQLLYDIKNVYTEEEKAKILPGEIVNKYRKY